MKIHEYQAKQIFKQYKIPTTKSTLIEKEEDIGRAIEELEKQNISQFVVKAPNPCRWTR